LVGGDHVSVAAALQAGTHVLMTSPSANRVYRSVFEPAVQEVRLSIGPGARLEWLPEVTIPFAGSRFRQSIHVDLAPGATLILWDAIASGRIAMGERWVFASVENEVCIRTASSGSAIERFHITPETVGGIAAEWDYVASLFVIGDAIGSGTLNRLKDAMADLLDRRPGEVLGGVSEPAAPGLAVKLVARSGTGLTEAVESLLTVARARLWGLSPPVLRRY
jgi:urease accessory protein